MSKTLHLVRHTKTPNVFVGFSQMGRKPYPYATTLEHAWPFDDREDAEKFIAESAGGYEYVEGFIGIRGEGS